MANEIKTPRITKVQRFEDIMALLAGEDAPNGSTIEDIGAFVAHEVELLQKKNASVDKRKAADMAKNDGFKRLIVGFLEGISGDGMTCTDIGKAIPELADFNTSKMSSLCNALVKDGVLTKSTKKGKTLFKLAD